MKQVSYLVFFFCLAVLPVGPHSVVLAQMPAAQLDSEFPIPHGFEGRIAFWRYIFTKYGENHRVFHHRDEPAIIYSVLDFSEINEGLDGKANYRARENAVNAELKRITTALQNLAKGKEPANQLERRIKRLFAKYRSATKREYRLAADAKSLRYQRGIKERFRDGLVRSGRYLYAIENIFRTEGLPMGLARLPLVESSFDYEAYSSVGAAGIWQFMRATGRLYLRIDASIDERRDPILATRAAARYLTNAYERLGAWPLAITSYNHGIVGVQRGVKQTGSRDLSVIVKKYKGKTFGFASSNFYAEFLAALEVERNAEFYFPGLQRERPWHFDEVRIGKSLRFSEVAKLAGVSTQELSTLNLSFKKPVTSNRVLIPRGSVVKLPKGRGATFRAAVPKTTAIKLAAPAAESKSDLKVRYAGSGQSYKVQRGDTVGAIARRYKVSQSMLLSYNGMKDPRRLRAGQTLKIPGTGQSAAPRSSAPTNSRTSAAAGSHMVSSGETLSGIASRYGVSQALLKKENGISNPRSLRVGQTLKIPGSAARIVAGGSSSRIRKVDSHTVAAGQTLSGIASRYGISQNALAQANEISNPRSLRVGQKLKIPNTSRGRVAKTTYIVKKGDTLGGIAKANDISLSQLKQLNPGVEKLIKPGQQLRVR